MLKIVKKRSVVYGNSRLSCQRVQKVQPFTVWGYEGSMEGFEHPFHVPFSDKRHRVMRLESLFFQQGGLLQASRLVCNIAADGTALQRRSSGNTFAESQSRVLQSGSMEAFSGRVFQNQRRFIQQQDDCRVNVELSGYLIEYHIKCYSQIQTAGNGHVYLVKGRYAIKVKLNLLFVFAQCLFCFLPFRIAFLNCLTHMIKGLGELSNFSPTGCSPCTGSHIPAFYLFYSME